MTDATATPAVSEDGWSGRCFEDFQVGHVYRHRLGRAITTADNSWFTQLTLNTNPLHFDHHYAAQANFGKPLVNSCFTLALVTGISVSDVSQNAMANLGWDEVPAAGSRLRGRHDLRRERGAGDPGVRVAAERRDRADHDARLQTGRDRRHRVQAHYHGVPPWARP